MYKSFALSLLVLIIAANASIITQASTDPSLKTRKLYASDFKDLGAKYINCLTDAKGKPITKPRFTQAPLYIKFVNETVGFGVFAEQDIDKGVIVGEYTGHAISVSHLEKINLKDDSYAIGPLYGIVVDAKKVGNITRFINHSAKPNLVTVGLYKCNYPCVVLISSEPIKKDQQLFFDYGEKYWNGREIQPVETEK
jgi:SET domain-containing protein